MTRKSFSARRQTVKSMPRATRLTGKTEFDNGSNGGSRTPRRSLNSVHRNAGCCPLTDLHGKPEDRTSWVEMRHSRFARPRCAHALKAVVHCPKPGHLTLRLFQRCPLVGRKAERYHL